MARDTHYVRVIAKTSKAAIGQSTIFKKSGR
jgi:hypothetical protein